MGARPGPLSPSGATAAGKGPKLVASAEEAAPKLALARAVAGSGTAGLGSVNALPTLTIPRRGARSASYYATIVPDFSQDGSWAPPTQEQSDGAALEAAIRLRHDAPNLSARAAQLQRAVRTYWEAVESSRAAEGTDPHRAEWEDGILMRLAASARVRHRWSDPGFIIPTALADRAGEFSPPPPSISPAVAVESMLNEVAEGVYALAQRRAAVDYSLKSIRTSDHRGILLHLLDTVRYVPPPAATRGGLGISFTARPLAASAIARSLSTGESLLMELSNLWHAGFADLSLSALSRPALAQALPLPLGDFKRAAADALAATVHRLRSDWLTGAAERVASFVLDVDACKLRDVGASAAAAALVSLLRARCYAAGVGIGQEYATPAAEARRAALIAAANTSDKMMRAALISGSTHVAAAGAAALHWAEHVPGAALTALEDITAHADVSRDATLSALLRVGTGTPLIVSSHGHGHPTTPLHSHSHHHQHSDGEEEKKGDEKTSHSRGHSAVSSRRGFDPRSDSPDRVSDTLAQAQRSGTALSLVERTRTANDVGGGGSPTPASRGASGTPSRTRLHRAAAAAAAGDPASQLAARLEAMNPESLSALTPSELSSLIATALHTLEPRDAAAVRRLSFAFAAAAVSMGACVRGRVYAALDDFCAFLAPYAAADAAAKEFSTPVVRVSLAFLFGEGAIAGFSDLPEPGEGLSKNVFPVAAVPAGKKAADKGKDKGAKDKAAEVKVEVEETAVEIAARNTLELSAASVIDPAFPSSAEDLGRLWAGPAAVILEPSLAAVAEVLCVIVSDTLAVSASFPRAEASAAGVAAAAARVVGAVSAPSDGRSAAFEAIVNSAATPREVGSPRGAAVAALITMGTPRSGGRSASGSRSAPVYLSSVRPEDEAVKRALALVKAAIDVCAPAIEVLRLRFDPFVYLFSKSERQRLITAVSAPNVTLEVFSKELEKLRRVCIAIDEVAADTVDLSLVSVDVVSLKDALKARARLLTSALFRALKAHALFAAETICARYARASKKLRFQPQNSEELVCIANFVKINYMKETKSCEGATWGPNSVMDCVKLLLCAALKTEYQKQQPGALVAMGPPAAGISMGELPLGDGLALSRSKCAILKELFQWPERLSADVSACNDMLAAEKEKMLRLLGDLVETFQKELGDTRTALDRLSIQGELRNTNNSLAQAAAVTVRLEKAWHTAIVLNKQQSLLDLPEEAYAPEIRDLQSRSAPFERLWQTSAAFLAFTKKTYTAPLIALSAEEATKEADGIKIAAIKVLRELSEDAVAPRALATRLKEDLDKFLGADCALLSLLANPGLKERHWLLMEGAVGFPIPHTHKVNLGDMLEVKLETKIAAIEEFCVTASKEYSLEKALDRMETEWQPLVLELKAYKTSGTHILTGTSNDAVQALLDDHIVKATTMAASRYAKALSGRINDWVACLTEIQAVLDVWLKVQSTWLYLEPIFSSEDIMQQMPVEGRRFKTVDETWRALVCGAVAGPKALLALRQPGQLAALTTANELLDAIQKGLNTYLESKRLIFPRFFFLSNDELLEILAETKDPTRVQPHLKKTFEGIDALTFEANGEISAMLSIEGESVPFLPDPMIPGAGLINPADSRGSVELWLLLVEAAMKRACAKSMDEAMVAYPKAAQRSQWAVEWPGQIVLAVTVIMWTMEVEATLRERGTAGLVDYAKICTKGIEEIIMKVRGKLTGLARKTLGALVVLDVHARDVIEAMAKAGVSEVREFEWNSQLRIYYDADGYSAREGMPGSVVMKMINAQIKYGYEYLGNGTRLVITPLTDRW